eukprot:COSAG02_NODE_23875_length_705_cov_1.371287_1_plen_47_part_10
MTRRANESKTLHKRHILVSAPIRLDFLFGTRNRQVPVPLDILAMHKT